MQISSLTTSLDSNIARASSPTSVLANRNSSSPVQPSSANAADKAAVVKSFSSNLLSDATNTTTQLATNVPTQNDTAADSVRVSSSIGKAASSGQLTREEALAIYQKIAKLL